MMGSHGVALRRRDRMGSHGVALRRRGRVGSRGVAWGRTQEEGLCTCFWLLTLQKMKRYRVGGYE